MKLQPRSFFWGGGRVWKGLEELGRARSILSLLPKSVVFNDSLLLAHRRGGWFPSEELKDGFVFGHQLSCFRSF